jgi:hypothetical protein
MVRDSNMAQISERSRRIQRQITITIALQSACPLIVTGGSLIFLYIGIKTEFHKDDSFSILFYSFMVFPVLNPIISLTFISVYRIGLVDLCRRLIGYGPMLVGWQETVVTVCYNSVGCNKNDDLISMICSFKFV